MDEIRIQAADIKKEKNEFYRCCGYCSLRMFLFLFGSELIEMVLMTLYLHVYLYYVLQSTQKVDEKARCIIYT